MPSIAIIEDEKPIAQLYKMKFELEGFAVSTAQNGHDGFKLVREKSPDLVLLDLRMPHMSGDEMLAKMRATAWGADIRVVILTNLSRDEALLPCVFLGLSATSSRPITPLRKSSPSSAKSSDSPPHRLIDLVDTFCYAIDKTFGSSLCTTQRKAFLFCYILFPRKARDEVFTMSFYTLPTFTF